MVCEKFQGEIQFFALQLTTTRLEVTVGGFFAFNRSAILTVSKPVFCVVMCKL